ncbi:MAG TPA: hypothetical protein VGB16_06885 [candidate division Zixibacteria bacterium]
MDKSSFSKEFPQTYEFFKDLKCSAWNEIIEHPDFCPSPKLEDYFTFVNQKIDKQSGKILGKKFWDASSIEQFLDYLAELQIAHFLFKNIHPQPIIEFIKEGKDGTPDIRIRIGPKNVSICVEVTRMRSKGSPIEQLMEGKLLQDQGEIVGVANIENVTEFADKSFAGLLNKLIGKKSQLSNCKADYKIFAVDSGRWSIDSSYFEDTDRYPNLKSEFQSNVDGILFFGCKGEKKLFSFKSNLKGLIDNVEYYEK